MKRYLFVLILLCLGFSQLVMSQEFKIDSLVEHKRFYLNIDKVNPSGQYNTSNLFQSGGWFLKVHTDSVTAYLPYIGRVYSGMSALDSRGGIEFEGLYTNYQVKYNAKRKVYDISFRVRGEDNDHYSVYISLTTSGYVTLRLSSNYRQSISYSGQLTVIADDE